ncbi:MAG: hypothetical protein ACJ8C4_17945 [Gemmataceae bacterium]
MIEYCLHAANLFYLVSFLARDILWLRTVTCAGLILGTVFFSCRPAPLYGPAIWHIVFLAINFYEIARLVRERRRMILTPEQRALAEIAFKNLTHAEMLNLLTRAICSPKACARDLRAAAQLPLTEDEQFMRDIALRGISRREMVHLLVRRLWRPLRWMNPWRHRQPARAFAEPAPSIEVSAQ